MASGVIAWVVKLALRGNGPSWSRSWKLSVDSAASVALQTAATNLVFFMGYSSPWRLACRQSSPLSTGTPSVYSAHARQSPCPRSRRRHRRTDCGAGAAQDGLRRRGLRAGGAVEGGGRGAAARGERHARALRARHRGRTEGALLRG